MAKNQLFATKPLATLLSEVEGGGERLKRALGPISLTALGIGGIIGTGIFVLIGRAANNVAGPVLMLSFVYAGLACVFAAFCYAEFASMAPVAGSAYTYAYSTLGELMAWIIGWDLILEYAVASSTVAHGWSGYFQKLLTLLNIHWFEHADAAKNVAGGVLARYSDSPFDFNPSHDQATKLLADGTERVVNGLTFFGTLYSFDLPAIVITLLVTSILVIGIKESAFFNAAMVAIKVLVVIGVILFGAFMVTPENWVPFAPYGYGGVTFFGKEIPLLGGVPGAPVGMMAGAAAIVFAYLGFDAVSTQAEEAKNPGRDVPIGIITSLVVCTILYIAMGAVLTGMVPFEHIDPKAPVASAIASPSKRVYLKEGETPPEGAIVSSLPEFTEVDGKRAWKKGASTYAQPVSTISPKIQWLASVLITLGALTGMTSVLLVMMLGQPRIFLAMARDGLLPHGFFAAIHPRFKTPWKSTILTGLVVATGASLLPLNVLAELTNIGTLFAFVLVCVAVLIMRVIDPKRDRPFKCPFSPLFPVLGIIMCTLLMLSLPGENWLRLVIWLVVGLALYFTYGYRHSRLAAHNRAEATA